MYKVISVRIEDTGNIDFFDINSIAIKKGDCVVVDIDGILEFGTCKSDILSISDKEVSLPLYKVVRIATKKDFNNCKNNKSDSEKALVEARKFAVSLDLNMNFISARYTLDRKKLFFSYLADDRVDFRELAKNLAQKYKTRIELRQVGVRDKAKLIGGLGPCGLFLCCNTFLSEFNSVSINMAKNQFLALNPSKINGVCDRLLCCLKYENDTYVELRKKFPKIGNIVDTEKGKGKVISVNIFDNTYKVEIDKNNVIELVCES